MKLLGAMFLIASLPLSVSSSQSNTPKHQPTTLSLDCSSNDCQLLKGFPQTAGLRSGFVHLNPGETVGWHTTGQNEETLVVLHGKGEAEIEAAAAMQLAEKMIAYIPPATRHNVKNTGVEPPEYVYVVAPAAEKRPSRPTKSRIAPGQIFWVI
jgi:mannose-6-phosphate isomerase-like protein (cupin superfamily)